MIVIAYVKPPHYGSIDPHSGATLMHERTVSSGKRIGVAALISIASCSIAAAQNAPPPPAVSVTPVVSRQLTETGD
jgi:hypothetical protein